MEPSFLFHILVYILSTTLPPLTAIDATMNPGPTTSLYSVAMSHMNLTGCLPENWPFNLTSIDMSDNYLTGNIPTSIGYLWLLQNLSLASNCLTGPVPNSLSTMHELVHLDLGSNQLNGTVPEFISEMQNLKFLNLENNKFSGIIPFSESFIKRLAVFKIGGNIDLCYDQTTISPNFKLGISPCGKHGLPSAKPVAKYSLKVCDSKNDTMPIKRQDHRKATKAVTHVAITLSSVAFLIVLLVTLTKLRMFCVR